MVEFGAKDDIPVPGDYYGDGITRMAVFKPSEGNWYIKGPGTGNWNKSTGNFIIQCGGKGDIPLPGDYRGIGRTQCAVYRPGKEGSWFIKGPDMYSWNSSQGNITLKFGTKEDIPVAKNFDGAGPWRLAVYRPSDHKWLIKGAGWADFEKSSGNVVFEMGKKHDIPVCADFFGEGKARFALFRDSEDTWLIKGPGYSSWESSVGNTVVKWGKDKDIPVPEAYGL